MLDANIAFSLEKPTALIHKREAAQTLWAGCLKSDEALEGLCLISGDTAPIARLHPAIKGAYLAGKAPAARLSRLTKKPLPLSARSKAQMRLFPNNPPLPTPPR